MKSVILLFTILACCTVAYADFVSPHDIKFSGVYRDLAIVKRADANGVLDNEIAKYLSSKSNPVDVKAAIISALHWNYGENEDVYSSRVYGKPVADLNIESMDGGELFCLGYLKLKDEWFNTDKAIVLLERARDKMKDSFTVSIVLALAKAQKTLGGKYEELSKRDFHLTWKIIEKVLMDKHLKMDIRPEAVKIIKDSLITFK